MKKLLSKAPSSLGLLAKETQKYRPILGGTPIDYKTALELRKIVTGSTIHALSGNFKKACFTYYLPESPYPYGLAAEVNGSRGIILCVQAYVIKHMVFKYSTRDDIFSKNVLQPSSYEKREALISALSEILWRAGEPFGCRVCLPQDTANFPSTPQYKYDGITEKFEGSQTNGCICFLYSLVMSRMISRVRQDHGDNDVKPLQLLGENEECTAALCNLLLTGRAVKHLHNGNIIYDLEGNLLDEPKFGVNERNDVGFLFWHRDEEDKTRTQVGSMLKTPKKPIWVTRINGQYGLLFSTHPDLVRDWRVEHKFTLHYYTGLASQSKDTRLTIDTRFGRQIRAKSARSKKEEEKRIPALDRCIMSKWYGADIDWHGQMPFI